VHSCGIASDGKAWCWGLNSTGQLGVARDTLSSGAPVAVSGGQVFDRVVAGTYHTCAIRSDQKAYCWGANTGGQLGDGTLQDTTAPAPVSGGLSFTAISAATNYSCGVTSAGVAYCWGTDYYGYGVLGIGGGPLPQMRNVPTKILGQP
jgi:alpha-tubulin suppressor-like RCC1 family protein